MTAAKQGRPRTGGTGWRKALFHIKTPSTALYFRRKQHEVCCARTGTGTGGNHQEYAVLA
ncbi:hypothetical protein ACLB1O_14060 [Escherichia coli]